VIDDGMALRSHRALRVQALAPRHRGRPDLGAAAAVALEVAERFLAAALAESAGDVERPDTTPAREQLVSAYDTARTVVMARLRSEAVGAASTALPSTDALLGAAEHLEAVLLEHEDEGWTRLLLEVLSPALDVAAREWAAGLSDLGSAALGRATASSAAAAFDDAFVCYRRVVRAELGRWSAEYRALCSRPDAASA
jgi:hypothetical protein